MPLYPPAGGGASYYQTVEAALVAQTQRPALNFTGAGVTVADDAINSVTTVTIAGGAASGTPIDVNVGTQFAPSLPTGANGDGLISYYDAGNNAHVQAQFVYPKAGGVWPGSGGQGTINANGDRIMLPYRSTTQVPSDLIPGWETPFPTAAFTGTVPADLRRVGTFASTSGNANASGTYAYLGRHRQNDANTRFGAMPFFSAYMNVSTLPEAATFARLGQFGSAGTTLGYGYGAQVDSAGNVSLIDLESNITAPNVLATGMVIAAGDFIIVERFGYRLTCFRFSAAGVLYDWANATASNRPLQTAAGGPQNAIGNDFNASIVAGQSYGYMTNSNSVRIANLTICG